MKKSEALKAAQGNPGHRAKTKKAAPTLDVAITLDSPLGTPPAFLSAKQRRTWDIAAPPIVRLNLLQRPDAIAFGRYIGWLTRYLDLERSTRRRPIVEETSAKAGKMDRLDKAFQALLAIDKRLQEYEDRFGMNPRERQALIARLAGASPAVPERPASADRPAVAPSSGPMGGLRGNSRLQ